MRVFVVTHTQSQHHVDGVVGGWFDAALTPRGHKQAGQIAQSLATRAGSAEVYSSDLTRAVQTAEPIAALLDSPIVKVPELREMSCGIAEGREQAWLAERITHPPTDASRIDHRIVEGAESRREVAARTAKFVEQLLDRSPEVAVVVTHGFAGSFLLAAWLGMPPAAAAYGEFELSPGGITTLQMIQPWNNRTIVSLNETAHLDAPE